MSIGLTDLHYRVMAEYGQLIGFGLDAARVANGNRGGLHRLAHLSPAVVDTQEKLATILAEIALSNVRERMAASRAAWVSNLLNEAKDEERAGREGYKRLLQLAGTAGWEAGAAYEAVLMLRDDEQQRRYIERDENRVAHVAIAPVPEIVTLLAGSKKPTRPRGRSDPLYTPFFDGGIVLMIHMASESALNPTRNRASDKTACTDIVREVLNRLYPGRYFAEKTISKKWEGRSKIYPNEWSLLPPLSPSNSLK